MPNVAESNFLIRVAGITDYFTTRTGGEFTADTSQTYNGGEDFATTIVGKKKADELVVSRPFIPERDIDLIRSLNAPIGTFRTTVSQQALRQDRTTIGNPTTWPNALLTKVTGPEANEGSSSAAMMELRFAVNQVV